jgi:aryl-alcohol dehydrogenase-like predicted oxidoreductase
VEPRHLTEALAIAPAIPGTSNPAHLAENVAAAEIRLSASELAALESACPEPA